MSLKSSLQESNPYGSFVVADLSDLHWESDTACQNLARKCEALAVSGLAEYGDEIDVVAPADILKQIFKIPYSKARLSVAVHRIGQALVLNTGYVIAFSLILLRCHNLNLNFLLFCISKSIGLTSRREKNWLEDRATHQKVWINQFF